MQGAGAEIVSGGELQKALAAGVPADMIMFAGVAKSRDEMALALDAGIAQFNVESVPELIALGEVAAAKQGEGAGRDPHQPGRRRRHPREDQHRPASGQVRHRLRPGGRGLRHGGAPCRHRAGRRASAYRLADHEPRPVRGRLPARRRSGAGSARRRHRDPPPRSGRRPGRALSGRRPPRCRRLCRSGARHHRGSGCRAAAGAGALSGRRGRRHDRQGPVHEGG